MAAIVVDGMKGIDKYDMTSWDSANMHYINLSMVRFKGKKLCYIKELCDINMYPNADDELREHLEIL